MIIIDIAGGLGNQMYGYALYRTLLERGRDVYMNISYYDHQNSPDLTVRKYELSETFYVTERFSQGFANFIRKFKLMRTYKDKNTCFQPEILDVQKGILTGCWESFKYSQEIEGILRKEFTFRKPLTGKSAQVINEIRSCNSVSVSFRRGDYVTLGRVLPIEYYKRAIQYHRQRIPDAKFFCVSDDIEWCKETFRDYDFTFIDSSLNDDSEDMRIISNCKYNILANSTFSMWGAWLNQNPDKIVLRPSKYFFSDKPKYTVLNQRKDFWPEDWISIEA